MGDVTYVGLLGADQRILKGKIEIKEIGQTEITNEK